MSAEIGFVLQLRGLSLAAYVAERDPVSGTVYVLSLSLFAAMPVLVSRRGQSAQSEGTARRAGDLRAR